MRASIRRVWEHDLAWSLRRSPVTVVAAVLTLLCIAGALFAPWIAPQNPYDLSRLELLDARLPPGAESAAHSTYVLGTDGQGRDMLSAILFYMEFQWYPTYLKEARGMKEIASGWLTGFVLCGGAAGCVMGGLLSDLVLRRTSERKWSQRRSMLTPTWFQKSCTPTT